jgi:hypothetical protein
MPPAALALACVLPPLRSIKALVEQLRLSLDTLGSFPRTGICKAVSAFTTLN